MGRVRTKTGKKSSRQVIERYYSKMTLDFHTNKKILEEVAIIPSKRLRNKIAGFSTHLMKRIQKGPVDNIEVDKETIELLASLGMSDLPGVILKEEATVVAAVVEGEI
ncbi:small ribosomal subunit protein eS17-like [Bidens hawaiensis]|uniref:small ribosomal subunit protein eS17-like n=1 Tax=Bidens hawaiensis TaxID=980011 RepID=UPI00404B1559